MLFPLRFGHFCRLQLFLTFLVFAQPCVAQEFAVIGDFGINRTGAKRVAKLVKKWDPEFIITLGDNNYYRGYAKTIDRNIGRHYHKYLHPYNGKYGKGADTLRFFPSLGNHDIMWENGKAHYDYFVLPGNERYYDFVQGAVHFFVLNSNPEEPDGITQNSIQAKWLQQQMANSTAPWKVVYFHHPPYTTGTHGSTLAMRWPFKEWGADIVLTGHDHTYERLEVNNLTYVVNGLGGAKIYPYQQKNTTSHSRYDANYGAMHAVATPQKLTFRFVNIKKEIIDEFSITKP